VRRETILAPGQTLQGRAIYVVREPIGMGAFALVYRGEDSAGNAVAIKEYRTPVNRREREVVSRMWRREMETQHALPPHPAMPRFVEGFSRERRDYVIQEYVEGENLADILDHRGALPQHLTVKWGRQVCEVAAYLHEHGIVHHDLKPENVIITPSGRAALLDLGSAQFLDRDAGDLHGSDGYLAPEVQQMAQRRGLQAQAGTDVFALGCMLYEMLLGQRPSQRHIDGLSVRLVGPLLSRLNRFDPGLVNVIVHAISYDADHRYQDAHEMQEALVAGAPAVPEVDPRTADFGALRGRERRKVTLSVTNAGGGTLAAEARSRAPWLRVGTSGRQEEEAVGLDGNALPLTITALGESMPLRQHPQKGIVEVRCPLGKAEIVCTARVEPESAMIQAYHPALFLRARRGQRVRGTMQLRNIGSQRGQFNCRCQDGDTVRLDPEAFVLEPMATQEVGVTVETRALPEGSHTFSVSIAAASGHRTDVEVHLDVFAGPVRRLLHR
jgi:tRNA A-37 threonylcarbamoyl transferase component Bud32